MDNKSATSLIIAAWVLIIILSAIGTEAEADESRVYWLLGDSLSSPHDSWANQLDDDGWATINNMSQPGLTLSDSSLPRYISCNPTTQVIIWLGTNDAGSDVHPALIERTLIDHLAFLMGRGCKVVILEPLPLDQYDSVLQARAQVVIALVKKHAMKHVDVRRIKMPYSSSDTTDTLHPTTAQQSALATFMIGKLNLQ